MTADGICDSKWPEVWVLATHRQPLRGARVKVGRILAGDEHVTELDTLDWWYLDMGKWSLDGMYWREW